MPTLFSRRYLRGKPSGREQFIGAGLLILIVLIIGAFLLTASFDPKSREERPAMVRAMDLVDMPTRPLFLAEQANMTPPAPPHEMRTAEAMLIELPAPWDQRKPRIAFPVRADMTWATATNPLKVHSYPGAIDGMDFPNGEGLAAAMKEYGAEWSYLREYCNCSAGGGATLSITAVIVDAGSPENAFGIFKSRQPAEAKPLKLGGGGWSGVWEPVAVSEEQLKQLIEYNGSTGEPMAGGWIGFWSGRYYTEMASRTVQSDSLEPLVRSLAGVQLVYGRPFWSERVLPAEGRLPESLRYVRRAVLGLDELSEGWQADYENGGAVAVMKLPAGGADRVLGQLRERLTATGGGEGGGHEAEDGHGASHDEENVHEGESGGEGDYGEGEETSGYESESDGADGHDEDHAAEGTPASPPAAADGSTLTALRDSLGPEAVIGAADGRFVSAFVAGEYLFVVAGREPAPVADLAVAAHTAWSPMSVNLGLASARPGAPHATNQARFAEVGGSVQVPSQTERFTDNLYEKIDGREGQYRAYHFVELRFGQYLDSQSRQTFDVYIYDMGEPENAFGIYGTERSPDPEMIPIGREAYASGPSVYFWKGRFYVNVIGQVDGGEQAAETARRIAAAIDQTFEETGTVLWGDEVLPGEDRVANSLLYRATSALGYEFLERVFVADYSTGGKTYQMFVTRAESPDAARKLYDQLVDATRRYDKLLADEATEGGATMVGESLGYFTVAFCRGVYLGGVTNCEGDRELAEGAATRLRDGLPAGPTAMGSNESATIAAGR